MLTIIHITAHMGGGVGKALSNITTYVNRNYEMFKHKIILLEAPKQMKFVDIALAGGVEVIIEPAREQLEQEIEQADIVQLEWWHHPKMAALLNDFPCKPVRLIVWSHISGRFYPMIPKEFIGVAQKFIFTSPVSYESYSMSHNTDVVYSFGGFEKLENHKKIKSDNFNVGYLGTLNFCKLNKCFVNYCKSVDIPDAKFILVGELDGSEALKRQVIEYNLVNKFEFTGFVNDIASVLSTFDVFAYILNPRHYGTTENALIEAMSFEIAPIVLNQSTEKYMVSHMETGMVVNNEPEYRYAIHYLYNNPSERSRIGKNAKDFVLEFYSLQKTAERLNRNYEDVMKNKKEDVGFRHIFGEKPHEWLLSCMGETTKSRLINFLEGKISASDLNEYIDEHIPILKEIGKSSISHFYSCFPQSTQLSYLNRGIRP